MTGRRRVDANDPRVQAYQRIMASTDPANRPTCPHDVPAGYVVRPWCGTPVCPFCRRGPRIAWRSVESVHRDVWL